MSLTLRWGVGSPREMRPRTQGARGESGAPLHPNLAEKRPPRNRFGAGRPGSATQRRAQSRERLCPLEAPRHWSCAPGRVHPQLPHVVGAPWAWKPPPSWSSRPKAPELGLTLHGGI